MSLVSKRKWFRYKQVLQVFLDYDVFLEHPEFSVITNASYGRPLSFCQF